jgi:multicomponent K+:H+ antiporter subunit G
MTLIEETVIALMLVLSGLFGLIGSFGLVKLRDPMKRLHAPTKASTVGLGTALIASMVYFWLSDRTLSWHELLITVFIFVTSPITAMFLAKAHIHLSEPPDALPGTGTSRPWATRERDGARRRG